MRILTLISIISFAAAEIIAQPYTIDARIVPPEFRSSHLKMGGSNYLGESFSANNYYMSINEKPTIPVTGEFHFTRYPNYFWDEAIKKIKAGGINILATYVFWNLHEEQEGKFNWTEDRNLRKFIELCKYNNVKLILRIGPYGHGEIRNGGLPDWLLGKKLSIRSNDPVYLTYVDRLYQQISKQIEGLLFSEGGPVFAIQLENEYQHSASPWGLTYPGQPHDWTASEQDRSLTQQGVGVAQETNPYAALGNQHMSVLKSLAEKNGLIVPLYTATGWGNAAVIENESIPVTAAYPYPNWAPASPSAFYLYTNLQKYPDYAPVRYKAEDYPYFAAEIGGGMMVHYYRRPVVSAKSLEALINRFLGSGANGIGYYMYHGGSTPIGETTFLSDEAFAYPKISYDFQAPLSEYGKPVESLRRLKLLHFFLNSFDEILAPMQVILPLDAGNINPVDVDILRYSMRVSNNSGFLFVNNFQDHIERKDLTGISFKILLNEKEIVFPNKSELTLIKDESAIFPVNLNLGSVILNYATAQLLTSGKDDDGEYFVFFAPESISPEFSIKTAKGMSVRARSGIVEKKGDQWIILSGRQETDEIEIIQNERKTRFLVIDKAMAMNSWIIEASRGKKLLISDALVAEDGQSLNFYSRANSRIQFDIYPSSEFLPSTNFGEITKISKGREVFSSFEINLPERELNFPVSYLDNKMAIDISKGLPGGLNDVICRINYKGDTGMGFLNGKLVADNLYNGVPWEIGLKRFMAGHDNDEMVFYFRPMYKNAEFLQDLCPEQIPEFDGWGQFLEISEPEFFGEYFVKVKL
jgi:beta-galactosidase